MNPPSSFADLGLGSQTVSLLEQKGYITPSLIQQKTIPLMMRDTTINIIGQSRTGSGKTAAFGLPIIEQLLQQDKTDGIQALILTPNRELALQIDQELHSFIGKRSLRVFSIYGGQSYTKEKRAIKQGIDILVATPGRIIDHLNNKVIDFSALKFFVLDEADEMLNMGFIGDIEQILKTCPQPKTMLFFSATMPSHIMKIAKKYMKKYEVLSVKQQEHQSSSTKHHYYTVKRSEKLLLLSRILDSTPDFYGIVFCKTKADVDELMESLSGHGYPVAYIHGDVSQAQREKTIKRFKAGKTKILLATDVASRGLDVEDMLYVINYAIPQSAEDYTHRAGRTGRAGKSGTVITFISSRQKGKLNSYANKVKKTPLFQRFPSDADVVNAQTEVLQKELVGLVEKNKHLPYQDIAKQLLAQQQPEELVASLLHKLLYKDLPKHTPKSSPEGSDNFGKKRTKKRGSGTRMFVARGRRDGLDPKKMVAFLTKHSHIPGKYIDDLEVKNEFSFFSTPPSHAKKFLEKCKHLTNDGKPVITLAKR